MVLLKKQTRELLLIDQISEIPLRYSIKNFESFNRSEILKGLMEIMMLMCRR